MSMDVIYITWWIMMKRGLSDKPVMILTRPESTIFRVIGKLKLIIV